MIGFNPLKKNSTAIFHPIVKKIIPPTILKLFTEIPKNLNKIWPEKAKAIMVKKAINVAFFGVCLRLALLSVEVIDIKIGIVPNGFIRVKNEVKTNKAKVYKSIKAFYFIQLEISYKSRNFYAIKNKNFSSHYFGNLLFVFIKNS